MSARSQSNNGHKESSDVPKKPQYPKQASNVLPNFKFIRCELSDTHKNNLINLISSGELEPSQCYEVVAKGIKFSLTADDKNKCFIATFSNNIPNSNNKGCSLSARGKTAAIAMCALLYKHFILLSEDWLSNESGVESDAWGIG